jgi:hypothetical protein
VYFNQPTKGLAHRALADILESVQELAYYRRAIFVPVSCRCFRVSVGPETSTRFWASHFSSDLARDFNTPANISVMAVAKMLKLKKTKLSPTATSTTGYPDTIPPFLPVAATSLSGLLAIQHSGTHVLQNLASGRRGAPPALDTRAGRA